MGSICRFEFDETVSKKDIEEKIALAIITAECTFGKPKVRLHAAYLAVNNKAVIDVSSKVGEHIAELFTGLMARQVGEENFSVQRMRKRE